MSMLAPGVRAAFVFLAALLFFPSSSPAKSEAGEVSNGVTQKKIVDLVNAYRKKQGLPVLQEIDDLDKLAQSHSADMAAGEGKLSHDGFKDRFKAAVKANARINSMGENVAYNFPSATVAEETVKNWLESPPHKKNIVGPKFTLTGFGIATGSDGKIYFTQIFAGLAPEPDPAVSSGDGTEILHLKTTSVH